MKDLKRKFSLSKNIYNNNYNILVIKNYMKVHYLYIS